MLRVTNAEATLQTSLNELASSQAAGRETVQSLQSVLSDKGLAAEVMLKGSLVQFQNNTWGYVPNADNIVSITPANGLSLATFLNQS